MHPYDFFSFFIFCIDHSICLHHTAGTSGWDKDPVTGVEYQRNELSVLNWYQARKSCQQQGGDLLSIVELHEQSYISGTKPAVYLTLLHHWENSR